MLTLRVGLGCEDPKLLETYLCLFCDNLGHTTRMCRVMRSLCRNCGHRGHVGTDHRLSDFRNILQARREKFHRHQHLGIRTRKAQGRESHCWGFRPAQEGEGVVDFESGFDDEENHDLFSYESKS